MLPPRECLFVQKVVKDKKPCFMWKEDGHLHLAYWNYIFEASIRDVIIWDVGPNSRVFWDKEASFKLILQSECWFFSSSLHFYPNKLNICCSIFFRERVLVEESGSHYTQTTIKNWFEFQLLLTTYFGNVSHAVNSKHQYIKSKQAENNICRKV